MATNHQGPTGPGAGAGPGRSKVPLIALVAVAALVVLGWLLWPATQRQYDRGGRLGERAGSA